jgi:hypothetical protein
VPALANQPPQQFTRPRSGSKKSLGNDEKGMHSSSRNSHNTRRDSHGFRTPDTSTNRPVRTLPGPRRDSDLVPRGDSTPQQPQETTPRTARRGRRGSIETRRLQQQRRGSNMIGMDSSSRRSSGGETGLDSSNDVPLRHSDPSLRHSHQSARRRLDSREKLAAQVRTGSSSLNASAADRRRSRTSSSNNGLLLSPELIAEKLLMAGEEDDDDEKQPHAGVYDELRRSQYRNAGGRRRSSAASAGEAARRGSIEPTRMGSQQQQQQLSQRPLRRSDPSAEDLGAAGTNNNSNNTTKATRRMSRSTDHGTPSGGARALRNSGAKSRAVRRVKTTDLLELSGGSIDDESGGRHESRRNKRTSQRHRNTMSRCRSEPTEILHDRILHADIDDDTVAAIGTEDAKTKALQRSQATAALSKALSENKAAEMKKVLQIQ